MLGMGDIIARDLRLVMLAIHMLVNSAGIMAGDEGSKPLADSFTRMLLQRRMLVNLIFFSSGLMLGCYVTTLSNDQHGTESAA